MDNDLKIVKKIKSAVKSLKFKLDYRDIEVISEDRGNELIGEMLHDSTPFMVARGGATEMRCIAQYLDNKEETNFSEKIKKEITELSGVFPNDDLTMKQFCELYIEEISKADLISLWGVGAESVVVHEYCVNSRFTKLHALEPYYFSKPWSRMLKEKKVLVVHPFVESIISQYKKHEKIYDNKLILPEFKSLSVVKAVQSIAGQKTSFNTWFEALENMKEQIAKCDFEVAIIGAGAYGLPLAAYCKSIDKQAIQMSGATQILFGVKGKRWDNHPVISQFYNEYWIRPSENEVPTNKDKVEGGSYW
ncbi:hypothetical protein [Priestia megaterium]|uniref:hypothetical protein n=2 Tax=Priestia megaterium TaxID=1404 RepID=UPI003C2DE3D3